MIRQQRQCVGSPTLVSAGLVATLVFFSAGAASATRGPGAQPTLDFTSRILGHVLGRYQSAKSGLGELKNRPAAVAWRYHKVLQRGDRRTDMQNGQDAGVDRYGQRLEQSDSHGRVQGFANDLRQMGTRHGFYMLGWAAAFTLALHVVLPGAPLLSGLATVATAAMTVWHAGVATLARHRQTQVAAAALVLDARGDKPWKDESFAYGVFLPPKPLSGVAMDGEVEQEDEAAYRSRADAVFSSQWDSTVAWAEKVLERTERMQTGVDNELRGRNSALRVGRRRPIDLLDTALERLVLRFRQRVELDEYALAMARGDQVGVDDLRRLAADPTRPRGMPLVLTSTAAWWERVQTGARAARTRVSGTLGTTWDAFLGLFKGSAAAAAP